MTLSARDIDKIRKEEFPELARHGVTYLNNASTGPLPARTVETLNTWTSHRTKPWTVSDQTDIFPALEHVRKQCANLIGADADEIALTNNTSYGLSLAANTLPLMTDDVVLISNREFPSIVYGWQSAAAKRGFRVKSIPTKNGLVNEEALINALSAGNVKAVAVSWVSFETGQRIDLERLGKACKDNGVFLVVDAMQGVGCSILDVKACQADIVSVGGYKWLLSPWGTGFLYVKRDLITTLEPPVVGWFVGPKSENYDRLLDYDLTHYSDARRFEVMTLATQDLIAMGSSLDLLLEIGLDAIETHCQELGDRLITGLAYREDILIVTPAAASKRAGIVTLAMPESLAVSKRLSKAGIIISRREDKLRISPHFYNSISEIDMTIEHLTCKKF